jgi:hypothetical protein
VLAGSSRGDSPARRWFAGILAEGAGLLAKGAGLLAKGLGRAKGFGRFFEALFSSAVADEIVRFVCSRVRRFAPYPLARWFLMRICFGD